MTVVDAEVVGSGLGTRLRDVRAAIERQSAFVFGGSEEPTALGDSDTAVARDFVLRSLATLADPVNYRLMLEVEHCDKSIAELRSDLDVDHVVVWERTNDLVQVGLMGRDLERDVAGLTPAGQQLVEFVEALAGAARSHAGEQDQ